MVKNTQARAGRRWGRARRSLAMMASLIVVGASHLSFAEVLAPDAGADAQRWVKTFVGRMKPMLMTSVQRDGPAAAIAVCAEAAPALSRELSGQSGWQISRVSSRPRNANRAIADSWEQSVLADFQRQLGAGAKPEALKHGAVVNGEERYMQAQVIGGVCLLCHGQQIAPDVQAALEEFYPDDKATGYALGDLRGAISLRRPVPAERRP